MPLKALICFNFCKTNNPYKPNILFVGQAKNAEPDPTFCGVCSGSPLYACRMFNLNLNENEKNNPANLKIGNGLVQLI